MNRRRRKLTKAELRAMGATPGLMARRYDADGRGRLEQLTAEAPGRPSLFLQPGSNNRSHPDEEGSKS